MRSWLVNRGLVMFTLHRLIRLRLGIILYYIFSLRLTGISFVVVGIVFVYTKGSVHNTQYKVECA